ncbi:hypothetical protein DL769_008623 [Monosporascus sp. CRB-8-3]|nr:hypothetical protein DL769_008623 [Monosporascus sp. CRB-8-3]
MDQLLSQQFLIRGQALSINLVFSNSSGLKYPQMPQWLGQSSSPTKSSGVFLMEGAAGVLVADIDLSLAADVAAECTALAVNNCFHAEAIQVDITMENAVQAFFHQTTEILGRIDYCINSAILEFSKPPTSQTLTREASISTRTQEARAVSDHSPGRGTTRGAMVKLGSGSSLIATPGVLPYITSKHGALGLTLGNARHGIRVKCVCPSWTDTPMVERAVSGVEGLKDIIQTAVPMGRIAMPEEEADAVIFLWNPRSSYVTGCSFVVDGGTTLTALR